MPVVTVLEADGTTQTDVTVNDNGRAAAAASAPIALATEDLAAVNNLAAVMQDVVDAINATGITAGTAGTPSSEVLSIQGIAGMVALPSYPLPATPVSGLTAAMTGTTSTAVTGVGAVASKFNYITQISVSNSHATVGTDVELQDGSGGTTFYVIPAAALYGGGELSFPTPLKQPTVNTALYAKNTTTGASTRISVTGFQA